MTRNVVIRTIDRAHPSTIAGLAVEGVATVHEAIGQVGLMDSGVRPRQTNARIAGSAVTVSSEAGDNIMVHAAVETIEPGDILVVTVTSPSTDGMIGELIAGSLLTHGCIGAVVDAGVRDIAELNELEFPVWSRAIHAQGTAKASPGSVNVPVVCGGSTVNPGDVVVADSDGVVVVPRASASDALRKAQARTAKEAETRARLKEGQLSLDIYGFRAKLADLGVEYLDE